MQHTEGFEQLFKMNKYFTSPFSDFNKALADIYRRSAQQQLEILGDHFGLLSNQLKRLSTIKKPDELLNLQKDYINETITMTIDDTQRLMHLFTENMEEIAKLYSTMHENTQAAAEKVVNKMTKKAEEHAQRERQ